MKPRLSQNRNAAMTLFEVGVIVAIVMILFAVIFPAIIPRNRISHAPGISCMNNLKQVGLAYKLWAGDNNDIYPMGVSVTNGGSMEMVANGNVLATFLVMSNELFTPKILFCPADTRRFAANNFGVLANSNLSYFVSADMTNDANPQMIVTGDSDWMLGGKLLKPGLASLWTNDPVAWGIRHPKSEHLGMADGSVQNVTTANLRNQLKQTSFVTNRFALP